MAQWELSIDSKILVTLALAPLVVCLVFIWMQNRAYKRSMLPPGPPGLPLIGNLLDMPQKDQSKRFSAWCKEYSTFASVGMRAVDIHVELRV